MRGKAAAMNDHEPIEQSDRAPTRAEDAEPHELLDDDLRQIVGGLGPDNVQ